jgi:hypothetical protein
MAQSWLRPGQALSLGCRGSEVSRAQHYLNAAPPSSLDGLAVDGIFGLLTKGRVIEFQRSRGLIADGVIGPHTAPALALTLGEIDEAIKDVRKMLELAGVENRQLNEFDRRITKYVGDLVLVTGGAVVAIPVILIVIILMYVALVAMLNANPRARQDFDRFMNRKVDELREALNLPSPGQVLQRVIENIREMVTEFIKRLAQERAKCNPTPEKMTKCSKESMAVAVATQNLIHKLGQLTFVGSRGFRLEDLVKGILASCGALIAAYAELGKCLDCEFIKFL